METGQTDTNKINAHHCFLWIGKGFSVPSHHTMETTLQDQLYMIQEQQKMRFKKRNRGKEDVAVIPNKSHHMHNDLELKTVTQQLGQGSRGEAISTDEASTDGVDLQFLQAQLEKLQLENSQLKSTVKQAEAKLVQLNHQREEERRAMGVTSGSVTQRIVELSKRNRELNAEIASERNKVRELQSKVKHYQKQEADASKEPVVHSQGGSSETEESLQSVVEQLKDQLQASNQKRAEYRNECQLLKQDLKVAHRVISKEVGEGASVTALMKSGSGWRGRSQQIIALQHKVSELQQQLEETGKARKVSTGAPAHLNADYRQITALKKLEDTKKKNLELTQSELAALHIEHSKLQQQCSALKSRNKILTAELKSLKSQTSGKLISNEPRLQSRPCSNDSTQQQDNEKVKVLEQRNQRLQTQLTKCVSELQTLRLSQKNGASSPIPESQALTRQPKSAPLPPLSRCCTCSVTRKMASAGHPHGSLEHKTLSQVSQVEKQRLFELTVSLQQRLDLTNDNLLHTETELRNLRQRLSGHREKLPKSELEERYELVKDENEVLKETLEVTRQEKLADIKLLKDLMRDTKNMFVDSVKQLYTSHTTKAS